MLLAHPKHKHFVKDILLLKQSKCLCVEQNRRCIMEIIFGFGKGDKPASLSDRRFFLIGWPRLEPERNIFTKGPLCCNHIAYT